MSEPYLFQLVPAHEATLVHIAIDAVDVPFTGVLPHLKVTAIGQPRFLCGVLRHHELVVVYIPLEVGVVEICVGVEQRLLLVSLLHQVKELHERVPKGLLAQSPTRFYVYHRQKVLVLGPALREEVVQLLLLWGLGTVEVVRAYLEPMLMSQVYVAFVAAIDMRTALRGLDIHVGHLGVVT